MKSIFNRFFNNKGNAHTAGFSYDQAVIIDIPFAELESSNKDMLSKVKDLEIAIEATLPPNSGVDGTEFGEGSATIYVYGPDANSIWNNVEGVLKASRFNHIEITLQFGQPDNPETKERKFTL